MGANLLHVTQFASMAPALFFITSLWQGLLLTAAAWLALKFCPLVEVKIPPRTRFVLWMIVFILSAVLPFSAVFDRRSMAAEPHSARALFSTPHLPVIWAVAIVGVWALASLFSMACLLWNIYRLDMLARTSSPLPAEALSGELRSLLKNSAGKKSVSRPVEIWLSDRVDSPVVIGFFRPAVVVPRWLWSKLTSSELNQIVTHELAHLERGDDWTNLLQKFLRALFPLNPALLLAERQLCWEREMACDDAVLDGAISPKEYATCLTNLAGNRLLRRVQSLAPGAWRRRSELAERVHRVLEHKSPLRPLHSRAVIGGFLAAYLCAGLVLARCPRLVTFTATASRMPSKLEAESLSTNHGQPLLRLALDREGMQAQSRPRVVEATLRTPVSRSRLAPSRVCPARLERKQPSASRSVSRGSLAARLSQPKLAQVPSIQVQFAQAIRAKARTAPLQVTETRLILNPADSPQLAPAVLAQAFFAQAMFLQAVERAEAQAAGQIEDQIEDQTADQAAPQKTGVYSGAELIFYLSPSSSLIAPGNRTSLSRKSADFRSPAGWIVIQL